jgi:hypothetical protein
MNENEIDKKHKEADRIQDYFFWITLVIEIILAVMLIGLLVYFIKGSKGLDIYSMIGITLIILWIGIMVVYFSWAIYFYNVNLGLTDKDWEKIEASKNTDNPLASRIENPEKGESLGLPAGTVRGSIALTILVGGLALFIASLGRDNIVKENQIWVDYFDFFKSAFLMMIAFYFGGKSLEVLLPSKDKTKGKGQAGDENTNPEGQSNTPSNGTI